MSQPTRLDIVRNILIDQLCLSDKTPTLRETKLKEELDADSLDLVEIVMSLEDDFSVTIPDEKAEELNTVGDILDLLEEVLGAENN